MNRNSIRKKEDFVCDPPSQKASEGRRNFVRKLEDFTCEQCGEKVVGDGYTDHCPKCLWGKHVDEVLPGDRASNCGGGMEPIKASYEKGKFRINYRCQKCGHEFWVRAADAEGNGSRRKGRDDNREKLLDLMRYN